MLLVGQTDRWTDRHVGSLQTDRQGGVVECPLLILVTHLIRCSKRVFSKRYAAKMVSGLAGRQARVFC